jgi:predicted small lipoprotein YifL
MRIGGVRAALLLLVASLMLVACGKKGPPDPPGPPNEINYPKAYPTR